MPHILDTSDAELALEALVASRSRLAERHQALMEAQASVATAEATVETYRERLERELRSLAAQLVEPALVAAPTTEEVPATVPEAITPVATVYRSPGTVAVLKVLESLPRTESGVVTVAELAVQLNQGDGNTRKILARLIAVGLVERAVKMVGSRKTCTYWLKPQD